MNNQETDMTQNNDTNTNGADSPNCQNRHVRPESMWSKYIAYRKRKKLMKLEEDIAACDAKMHFMKQVLNKDHTSWDRDEMMTAMERMARLQKRKEFLTA